MVTSTSSMLDMDFRTTFQVLVHNFSYIIPAMVLLSITIFFATRSKAPRLDFPFYGNVKGDPDAPRKRWMSDAINLLREGRSKYPDTIFKVWTTEGIQLVIPPKYVDELKMKSDTIMPTAVTDFFQGKHTSFTAPWRPQRIGTVIRVELNKNMPRFFPGVKDELDYSLPREFPPDLKEWTPIKIYPRMSKLVFRVSGRVFAGPELSRNDEWMMLNINYTRDAFNAALEIRKYPEWLRPYVKYFIPEVRSLWAMNAKGGKFLAPLIKERNEAEKLPGYEGPGDTLEWVRLLLPDWEKKDMKYQAIQQLGIGAASIHTTSMLATNVIFDLAARPEYISELREEVQSVLEKYKGEWTIESMADLKKMDSFIKESQRFQPTVISFQRKAAKPITLSDGTHIPKGAYFFAPSEAISHDPTVYENPDEFDGWRFYNMRQTSSEENKWQFVTVESTQMHFGGGRHACPGRWFASHEIKLIVASLIMKFDLKTVDGVGRPKNIMFQQQVSPDPMADILLKSRT